MNYEEFLFDRAMEYMFKKAIKDFESFFQYSYKYFNRTNGKIKNYEKNKDTADLYSLFITFASQPEVMENFSQLKGLLTKEPLYNVFWHLTDGYLTDLTSEFQDYLKNAESISHRFVDIFHAAICEGLIDEEHYVEFVQFAIKSLEKICKNEAEDAEKDLPFSSREFAEIVLLKQIIVRLKELIYKQTTIIGITF